MKSKKSHPIHSISLSSCRQIFTLFEANAKKSFPVCTFPHPYRRFGSPSPLATPRPKRITDLNLHILSSLSICFLLIIAPVENGTWLVSYFLRCHSTKVFQQLLKAIQSPHSLWREWDKVGKAETSSDLACVFVHSTAFSQNFVWTCYKWSK